MKKLILDDYTIPLSTQLAVVIGVNEAIVVQQIHYWLKIFEEKQDPRHYHDDRWWVFNTVKNWSIQFPFWSERTLERIIHDLEKLKILIVGNYNRYKYDRTKWYTIDYDVLQSLINQHSDKLTEWKTTTCRDGLGQLDVDDTIDYIIDFPTEITKENGSSENEPEPLKEKIIKACISNGVDDRQTVDDIVNDILFYYWQYEEFFGKPQPKFKQATYNNVVYQMTYVIDDLIDPTTWQAKVTEYFDRDIPKADYHLPHFVSEGVQEINDYYLM